MREKNFIRESFLIELNFCSCKIEDVRKRALVNSLGICYFVGAPTEVLFPFT